MNDQQPWSPERRRSSMSMHSRRNSILSVSLFDFALQPPRTESADAEVDPFAPLSIHEGIAMGNKYPEYRRYSNSYRYPPAQQLLSDRSESSLMSASGGSFSIGMHPVGSPRHVLSPPHVQPSYVSSYLQTKVPATVNPITPDQCIKPPPFAPVQRRDHTRMIARLPLDDDDDDDDDEDDDAPHRFKAFHEEKWTFRYKELLDFHKEHGHAAVPHTYPKNPQLARWVKRQRRQYKLRKDGRPSTMTSERLDLLDSVNFIWDSHDVNWREKLEILIRFRRSQGHCNVPSNFPDKKLATWVKCQRRQYKLYWDGKPSAMTPERIMELERVGFEWEIRATSQRRVGTSERCPLDGPAVCQPLHPAGL